MCNCGKRGCLEAVASGTAIGRRATELVMEGALQTTLPKREISSEEVVIAAHAGDALATQVLDEVVEYLAQGIGIAVTLLNPSVVIIGGGLSEVPEELLLKPIRKRISKYALDAAIGELEIVNALLGYDAGVLGAAALAILHEEWEGDDD